MNRAVSPRSFVFGAVALAAALALPAVASAQDAPAPAGPPPSAPPDATTAQPAPPPGNYPPPPPRYPGGAAPQYPQYPQNPQYPQYPQSYPPPPPNYYPPPPHAYRHNQWAYYPQTEGVYRPISLSLGVGPGFLLGPGEHKGALSYNLFRLGFGIAPNMQLTLAFEGTGANSTSPLTGEDSWLKQENWMLGIQYWLVPRVYFRLGVGAGVVSEHTATIDVDNGTGVAMGGGLGFEFIQTRHVALALDLNGSFTQYSAEHWGTLGANLQVSFY